MKLWLVYAVVSLIVVAAGAGLGTLLVDEPSHTGVWFGAGVAWLVQLIGFGILRGIGNDPRLFMVGWLGGMVLRLCVVAGLAIWLTRTIFLPPEPTLLTLVVLLFLLLLLEPVFLGRGRKATQ